MFLPNQVLLVPILAPIFGALLVLLLPERHRLWAKLVGLFSVAIALIAASAIFLQRASGSILQLNLLHVVDYGLSFRPSFLGALLAVVVAGLWMLATIFAVSYLKTTHSPRRFFASYLVSLAGCVGVFLATDYFTFFIFFELMTFAAYPLVVHAESDHARRAGDRYLYMSVAGGLVLLFGILLLVWATGTAEIAPQLHVLLERGVSPYVVALMFIVGFGLKMGLVPLHIWLPYTYVSAPAPATAMFSGAMNKTGVYGMIVFLTITLATGVENVSAVATRLQENLGLILLGVGLLTMLMGGFFALMQRNIKRLLAYSSISQMGYILLAVASTMYLNTQGGLAHTAGVFHAFSHALFSTALFLLVGVIYYSAGSLLFDRLGGLARFLPFTAAAALVAALSVLGLPGFGGFGSKTLIHKALVAVAEHSGSIWLLWAERLFVLGSALTAAYFIKLYVGVFFGQYKGADTIQRSETLLMKAVLGILCLALLVLGVLPGGAMHFMSLAAEGTLVDTAYLAKKLVTIDFWTTYAVGGVIWPFVMGIVGFMVARYFKFFVWKYPKWLSIEAMLYRPLFNLFLSFCCLYATRADGGICDIYDRGGAISGRILRRVKQIDDLIDEGYEAVGHGTAQVVEQARQIDVGLGQTYSKVGHSAQTMAIGVGHIDEGIDAGYKQMGKSTGLLVDGVREATNTANPTSVISLQNITLGSLIVAVILLVVLIVLYVYGSPVL